MTATHHGHPRRGCKARALDRLTTVLYPVSVGRSRSTNEDRIHMNTANEGSKDRTSNSSITSRGPHPLAFVTGIMEGGQVLYPNFHTFGLHLARFTSAALVCSNERPPHVYRLTNARGCVPLSLSTRSVPATREPPLVQSDTRAIASQRCSITGSHNGAVLRNRTAIQNRADRHEIPIVVNIVPFWF